MSLDISRETEASINDEARREGVSVDVLLKRFISEREAAHVVCPGATSELPTLHLGAIGAVHRRDIYDDVG